MPVFDPLLEWLGIPPQNRPVDYYTLLGLGRFEGDVNLIIQAFQARQNLIQRYLQGPYAQEACELLAILAQAQACLLDPARKAAYDEQLRTAYPQPSSSAKNGFVGDVRSEGVSSGWQGMIFAAGGASAGGTGDGVRSHVASAATGGGSQHAYGFPSSFGTKAGGQRRKAALARSFGGGVRARDSSRGGKLSQWAEYAEFGLCAFVGSGVVLILILFLAWSLSGAKWQTEESTQLVASSGKTNSPNQGTNPVAPGSGSGQARSAEVPASVVPPFRRSQRNRAASEAGDGSGAGSTPAASSDAPNETPRGNADGNSQSAGETPSRVNQEQVSPEETKVGSEGPPSAARSRASDTTATPRGDLRQKLALRVDLRFIDTPLEDALRAIGEQFDISIIFDDQLLSESDFDPAAPVTLFAEGITLEEALRELLEPLQLEPEVRENTLVVTKKAHSFGEVAEADEAIPFLPEAPPVGEDGFELAPGPSEEDIKQTFQFAGENLPPVEVNDEKLAEVLLSAWEIKSLTHLQACAEKVRHASEFYLLLQVYDRVFAKPDEKPRLKDLLNTWKSRAERNLVRLGKEWLPPEDWLRRKNEARQAFIGGLLVIGRRVPQGITELEKASRLDPEFVTAHFVLGILSVLIKADYRSASRCFQRCLARDSAAVAALNNLAVCAYRLGAPSAALSYLRRAVRAGGSPEATHNILLILKLDELKLRPLPPSVRRGFVEILSQALLQFGREAAASRNVSGFLFMRINRTMLREDGWLEEPRGTEPRGLGDPWANRLIPCGSGTAFLIAPGYALTNRHVVENSDAWLLFAAGGEKLVGEAKVVGVASQRETDLAIMHCSNLKGKPLRLNLGTNYARVGSEICVIGYPRPTDLGLDLKCTEGRVVAEPSQRLGNFYFLSVGPFDLSGNSGGPVLDRRGNVIGVFCFGVRFFGNVEKLCGAVPCSSAVPLLAKLGITVTAAAAEAEHRPWDEILLDVKDSVYLVLCYSRAAPQLELDLYQLLLAELGIKGADLSDPWCLRCQGTGKVDCSNPRCGRGFVSTTRERVVGQNPNTGQPIIIQEPTRIICDACKGAGRMVCPVCQGTRVMGVTPGTQSEQSQKLRSSL